jgi:hypothetical protein
MSKACNVPRMERFGVALLFWNSQETKSTVLWTKRRIVLSFKCGVEGHGGR